MDLVLKENVHFSLQDKKCILTKGINLYEIEDKGNDFFDFLSKRRWECKDIPNEYFEFLSSEYLITKDFKNEFENTMFEKNVLFFAAKNYSYDTDYNKIQKDICQKTFVILGCGGIGTVVLQNLVSLGIEKFILIDFDEIDLSNLNRQLFFTLEDIGKKKVEVLKQKLFNINPELNITCFLEKIENSQMLSETLGKDFKADFFVNCADTPSDIYETVLKFCREKKIPSLNGGVGIDTGYWGPIVDPINSNKDSSLNSLNKKYETVQGSLSSTNMIIGSFMAQEIVNFLLDEKSGKLFRKKYINFESYVVDSDA